MRRLYKALAVVGMLLCFTLGAFEVSFAAHDSPSRSPFFTVELPWGLANGSDQLTRYTPRFAMESEAGEVPNSARPELEEIHVTNAELAEPIGVSNGIQIHTSKVSLQILELVLLL
jgi:hypothetical protein